MAGSLARSLAAWELPISACLPVWRPGRGGLSWPRLAPHVLAQWHANGTLARQVMIYACVLQREPKPSRSNWRSSRCWSSFSASSPLAKATCTGGVGPDARNPSPLPGLRGAGGLAIQRQRCAPAGQRPRSASLCYFSRCTGSWRRSWSLDPGAPVWKDEDHRTGMPGTPARGRGVGHSSCPLVPVRRTDYWHVAGTPPQRGRDVACACHHGERGSSPHVDL